jgi:spore maturation protein CgeB
MRIALFCQSIRSCWDHRSVHFLRGVVTELSSRGHDVVVFEPDNAWSVVQLVRACGPEAASAYRVAYPGLDSRRYTIDALDLDEALDGVDLVLVHEWTDPRLVARLGAHRRGAGYRLLFHDNHHRAVTSPLQMTRFDLRDYDGVLAGGAVLRRCYLERGWAARAWTWHDAADARVFRPVARVPRADLVFVGPWGEGERASEIREFVLRPARACGVSGAVVGLRYATDALTEVTRSGLQHERWAPDHQLPQIFGAHRVTIHLPRREEAERMPGVAGVRLFQALACGIAVVSAPWHDDEGLLEAGRDYLVARSGMEMERCLRAILREPELAAELAVNGRRAILARHTCAHRVDQLFGILREMRRGDGARRRGHEPTQRIEQLERIEAA